jgi:hypothetical protein
MEHRSVYSFQINWGLSFVTSFAEEVAPPAAKDNQLAWPLIPFSEGWYGAFSPDAGAVPLSLRDRAWWHPFPIKQRPDIRAPVMDNVRPPARGRPYAAKRSSRTSSKSC